MKKYFLALFTFAIFISAASAGEKRINLYGGYVFDDKFDSYYDAYNYFNGKIKGGLQYGAGLEFVVTPYSSFELLYIGQQTTAPTYYYPDGTNTSAVEKEKILDINFNYAYAGLSRYFKKEGSSTEWYAGFMLGALFADAHDPESGESRNTTKFSWGLRLGSNLWLSDKIGIKMQGMLLLTTATAGGKLYFGSGGYGPGSTTPSSMLQLSLNTGIVYKLGNKTDNE